MARNPKRRELNDYIEEQVLLTLRTERLVVHELTELIKEGRPDLWRDLAEELATAQIAEKVRRVCKRAADKMTQPLLPGLPDLVPTSIAVPRAANDEDPYYIAFERATYGELCASEDMLSAQIVADIKKRDVLRTVRLECKRRGAKPDDRVADILRDQTG